MALGFLVSREQGKWTARELSITKHFITEKGRKNVSIGGEKEL